MGKVLVTGGLGYLGTQIARRLRSRGKEVTLLSRRPPAPDQREWAADFNVSVADVSKPVSLAGLFSGVEAVVHAAALNEGDCRKDDLNALLVNAYGTRNVLVEAAKAGVARFVYLSTFHVYGPPKGPVVSEDVPPAPVADYSLTHLAAEHYCLRVERETGMKTVSLRVSNGYGAPMFRSQNCWMLVLNDFCKRAVEEGRIVLKSAGTQERDFVAIPDVLDAVELALAAEAATLRHPVYNVGGETSVTIRAAAELCCRLASRELGRTIKVEFAPDVKPADIAVPFLFDCSRLKALGYKPKASMEAQVLEILGCLRGELRVH